MVKDLKTLPEDIYAILEGKGLYDSSVVDRFGESLKDVLHKRLKQEDRKPVLRMSNLGKPLRQLYYELNGIPSEKISGKTLVKFAYGELCEALVIALAEAAGHEASRFQEELEVDGVKGHIDLVLSGYLVDVKSCSAYSFQKFKDGSLLQGNNDPFAYKVQLASYAKTLGLPAAWVAFDKVSGEVCVLVLPQEMIDSYDVGQRIQEVRTATGLPTEPERCYEPKPVSKTDKSGNLVLDVGCSYCGWKGFCWRDSNNGEGLKSYFYSTGPKYFVHIEKEPRVEKSEFTPFTKKEEHN